MVMLGFVPLVVRRYLGSRRGFTRIVTIFSVAGILLGVAALLIVLAVMSGFRAELMSRILGVSGHATIQINGLDTAAANKLAAELQQIQGIASATPYVTGQVLVSANGHATGAYVRGIEVMPRYLEHKTLSVNDVLTPETMPAEAGIVQTEELEEGNSEHATDAQKPQQTARGTLALQPEQVLLGTGVAAQLGVLPGSAVTLLSPDGARTVMGLIPRTGQFAVAGTFSVGMLQFDNGLVLGRLDDMQAFLRRGQMVDAVEVRLTDPQQITALSPQIYATALRYAESELELTYTPWTEANAEFFRALQVERVTMFIILSLIVLVAAFNIITGQMMLVNDKMGDIAILRTMGATQRQIRRIFLFNGLLLGGMGTLGGVGLGMLVIWRMTEVVNGIKLLTGVDLFPRDVYFLSELPGKLSLADVLSVLAMALALTVLASLYPAWRASKLNPVELLRRG